MTNCGTTSYKIQLLSVFQDNILLLVDKLITGNGDVNIALEGKY
jgi:hypothetical protein